VVQRAIMHVAGRHAHDQDYIVTGELGKVRSCVWIEDRVTGKIATAKVCQP
jgi:hypothetical protein